MLPRTSSPRRLGVVARAVSTRTSVQILSGILLEAQNDELRLAATDMELSLRATVAAHVEGDGVGRPTREDAAPTSRGCCPADEVTIEHRPTESVVHVTSGSASYTLNTYNRRGLPASAGARRDSDVHRRPASRCSRRSDALPAPRHATSRVRCSPASSCSFEGGKLVMAATDSYRLAVKETALEGSSLPDLEAIMPSSCAAGARAHRRLGATRSSSACTRTRSSSPPSGVWLTTRRIDGQFPNYRQLLPEAFEHELTLPRERAARRRPPRLG